LISYESEEIKICFACGAVTHLTTGGHQKKLFYTPEEEGDD